MGYKQKTIRFSLQWLKDKMIENWNKRTLQSPPLQESEQMYPKEFVIWVFENVSMTCDYGMADSNPFYVGCDEMEFKTLPELLTYWKDNVQGKLMVDKFKMK